MFARCFVFLLVFFLSCVRLIVLTFVVVLVWGRRVSARVFLWTLCGLVPVYIKNQLNNSEFPMTRLHFRYIPHG